MANAEQTVVFDVQSQARWLVTAFQFPPIFDRQSLCVEGNYFVFVFNIHENSPFFVRNTRFWIAAQFDSSNHFFGYRVNHGCVSTCVVEHENPTRKGVKKHCIWLFTDRNFARHFERFGVKNGDGIGLSVGRKSFIEFRCRRHAMHAFGVRNDAQFGVRIGVQNLNLVAVREVQLAQISVH